MKNLIFIFFLFPLWMMAQPAGVSQQNDWYVENSNDSLYSPWGGGINVGMFSSADMDGDGKKDIVVFDKSDDRFSVYLNLSNPGEKKYSYSPKHSDLFQDCQCTEMALLRDMNCDGREDVVCEPNYNLGNLTIYYQTGVPGAATWQHDPNSILYTKFNNNPSNLAYLRTDIPAIDDIDYDGDNDILSFSTYTNYVVWYRNMSVENTGACDSIDFITQTECWGHFYESSQTNSAFINDTNLFYCPLNGFKSTNCHNARPGENTDENPETRHFGSTVLSLDLDGNGLKDLVIGDISYKESYAVYNCGALDHAYIDSVQTHFPNYDTPTEIELHTSNFYLDADNDGKRDLLSSTFERGGAENKNHVWFYQNTNLDESPIFHLDKKDFIVGDNLDFGTQAAPTFCDYNQDGLKDIIVGNWGYYDTTNTGANSGGYRSGLALLVNVGTSEKPRYKLSDDDYLDLISTGMYPSLKVIVPTVGDLDGDGDEDLVLGNVTGRLTYFQNNASGGNAVYTYVTDSYAGIDAGDNSAPFLYDLDQDNDLDLLVGNQKGYVHCYKNDGSASSPSFTLFSNYWGKIRLYDENISNPGPTAYANTQPFIADYDEDGDIDLLLGNTDGDINIFTNLNLTPNDSFPALPDFFNGKDFGGYTRITGAFADTMGHLAYLIGGTAGGLQLLHAPYASSVGNELAETNTISLSPNPSDYGFELVFPSTETRTLRLFNTEGKCVWQQVSQSDKLQVEVPNLAAGMYLLQIQTAEQSTQLKWVKK